MIGGQKVLFRHDDRPIGKYTAEIMSLQYDEALDESNPWHEEARHSITVIADKVLFKRPIKLIFAHLGLSTDLSAGTMGEPNIVDERAILFKEALQDVWVKNARLYFQPPHSKPEVMKRVFLDAMHALSGVYPDTRAR